MTDTEIENKEINSENVENKLNERDCSICYSHAYANIITLCNHIFCISCLMQFRRAICPLCRNDLVNELPPSVLTIINNNTENNNLYNFFESSNINTNEHDIYSILNSRYNILPNMHINTPPRRHNNTNFFNRMYQRIFPRNITQRVFTHRMHPYMNQHRLFNRINQFVQRNPVRIDDLMGYNINDITRYIDNESHTLHSDDINRIQMIRLPNLYNRNGFLF